MSEVKYYEPALICMGVIMAPYKNACSAIRSQLERAIGQESFGYRFECIAWKDFFEHDGTFLDGKRFQIALLSAQVSVTIYVCNLADGWISVFDNVVRAEGFDAYFFRATLADSVKYKVFEMRAWRSGFLSRQVRALQEEGGWTFINEGDSLPFEDASQYKKNRISERLNRNLIECYSKEVGFDMKGVTRFLSPSLRFFRNM